MPRLARSLALALVAAYLAAATTPCPAPARAEAEARRFAGPAVHASQQHVHDAISLSNDAVAATFAADLGAASGAASLSLTATCLCGCGERPTAGATPIGVGWAMVSRASLPRAPASAAGIPAPAARAPEAPVRAVDHVPLSV